MKKLHRSLSWLLLLAMLFSMLSVGGFAADDTISTTTGVVETTSVPAAEEEAKEEAPAVSETPAEKAPVVSETPTEDNAADTQNALGIKPVENAEVTTESANGVEVQEMQPPEQGGGGGTVEPPNEKYYNANSWLSYDAYETSGRTMLTAGLTSVKVSGTDVPYDTSNSCNTKTVKVSSAISSGIALQIKEGYRLVKYRIVCSDKYDCETNKKYGLTTDVDPSEGMGTYTISTTKVTFGHSKSTSDINYWLLLDIEKDDSKYNVTYNWGDLTTQLSDYLVPTDSKEYKINQSATVLAPSAEAITKANELGYEFKGWKVTGNYYDNYIIIKNANDSLNITGNLILIAQWEEIPTQNITITKKWEDNSNQDGKRPASITVTLKRNGEVYGEPVTVTGTGDTWTYTFEGVPKEGDYTVTENAVAGYTTTVSDYTITNTHIPETTSVSGTKTWNDDDNRDRVRPDDITVTVTGTVDGATVYADSKKVEDNGADEWSYSFTNLPKYNGGKEITYTVTEAEVEGYKATYDGNNITNTHKIDTISITVKKIWNDKNNQDNIRPDHIEFYLYANDEMTDATYCISASDDWMITIPDLPKNENGEPIKYTVKEFRVAEGYTSSVNGFFITNTHDVATTSVSVEKKWDDANNQDGLRAPVTIELLADGKMVDEVTLNEGNNWKHTFTGLDVNAAGFVGKAVEYTVKEVTKVDGYEAGEPVKTGDAENGYAFTITNTHTPATYEKITVTKVWDDNENQDGKRTPSVQVTLLANAVPVENGTVTLNESNNWTYAFENLPVKSKGEEIKYSVVEITDLTQRNYSTVYSGNAKDGFVVTNSHTPETTDITVFKAWDDNDNQDGLRPASIKVQLYADGQPCGESVTITPTAEGQWFYNFEDLPVYAGGKKIEYTVKEVKVTDGYTATVGEADNDYTITNSHTPETTSISGKKIWNDDNNRDGLRSDDVYIEVIGTIDDGEEVYGYGYLVTEDDDWAYTFENLPVYFDGKKITYTLQEDMSYIEGFDDIYVSTVVEDKETGEINVINTHIPETTSITVNKVWADNNDQDGIRPEEITVYLTVKGEDEPSYIAKMTPDKDGKWSYTFFGLPKYKDREEITYVVSEEKVEGYESEVSVDQQTGEVTITNTHNAATTKVSIEKVWKDNNDKKEKRPDSIKVTLYANGKEVTTVELNEKNQWKTEIENLPVNANGKAIEYTVKEAGVKYYVGKVTGSVKDGFTVTNTFVDIPLTGDTMNLLFWSIMILGAGAVLTGVTVHNRRKRA